MPVVGDDHGRLTVERSSATAGLAGRMFRRREPQSDCGDTVIVLGAIDVGGQAGAAVELCVQSATFGAVPDGWGDATVTYDLENFASDYTELNDAERATLALEQATESKAAAKSSAKRQSPWGLS